MSTWRPKQYLLFEEERTRPVRDLVAQIPVASPRSVVDLGCGPGNSTAVLATRWPAARITGLDSSAEMLDRARQSNPRLEWVQGDITEWSSGAGREYDIVFSNAALQWVTDHAAIYPRLLNRVAAGGALAVQVPANINEPAHQIMRDLASSSAWRDRFPPSGVCEWFVHGIAFYYDVLAPAAKSINIWEMTYIHVMPDVESITEWYKATGMRPFLDCLPGAAERERFIKDYTDAIRCEYKPRPSGSVLFPFRRLFLIATTAESETR